jgi:hypothetical protein
MRSTIPGRKFLSGNNLFRIHIDWMADYVIVLDGLRGYGVEITLPGCFRSVRGFATEAAARSWIEAELLLGQFSQPEPEADPTP